MNPKHDTDVVRAIKAAANVEMCGQLSYVEQACREASATGTDIWMSVAIEGEQASCHLGQNKARQNSSYDRQYSAVTTVFPDSDPGAIVGHLLFKILIQCDYKP